ncbi:MAG: hypothetical protein BroJett015_32700 [Chloroflexota bacterium]|nr:MAG: hypothetical protein BroJett015_32700 [Chloroflexota bacterium]
MVMGTVIEPAATAANGRQSIIPIRMLIRVLNASIHPKANNNAIIRSYLIEEIGNPLRLSAIIRHLIHITGGVARIRPANMVHNQTGFDLFPTSQGLLNVIG